MLKKLLMSAFAGAGAMVVISAREHTMNRKLLIGGGIAGGIVVVVVIVAVVLYSSLDSLIEAAVEGIGSDVTQTTVSLKAAKVSPASGAGALTGLEVGNPKGFETDSAFRLGEVSVKLDVGSLTKDVIVIDEVVIAAPEVTYELGPEGSNIDAIKRNVDSYVESIAGASSGGGTSGGADEGPKLIIRNLYVRDGVVKVSATALAGKTLSAPLPDLHLTDIGKDKGGATPGEAVEKVLASVTGGIGKAIQPLDLGAITGAIGQGVEGTGKTLKEGAEGAAGAVTEGVEGAGESLKKLLGD